ncbi:MAG: F-box/LRR-repeat protein 14 [Chlamydiia bacterium]|nr:F-box/LRR-repeat protein 14 [Chlamydiia bacterium]
MRYKDSYNFEENSYLIDIKNGTFSITPGKSSQPPLSKTISELNSCIHKISKKNIHIADSEITKLNNFIESLKDGIKDEKTCKKIDTLIKPIFEKPKLRDLVAPELLGLIGDYAISEEAFIEERLPETMTQVTALLSKLFLDDEQTQMNPKVLVSLQNLLRDSTGKIVGSFLEKAEGDYHKLDPNLKKILESKLGKLPLEKTLTALALTGISMDQEKMRGHMLHFKEIEHLSLISCKLTDTVLNMLTERIKLKTLDLSSSNLITKLPKITQALTELQHLIVSDCRLIDSSLTALAPCKGLITLDISYNRDITDAGIATIVKDASKLTSLNLAGCVDITASGIESLKTLKNLTELDLSGLYEIPVEIIIKLIKELPNLEKIHLNEIKFSPENFEKLLQAISAAKNLSLSNCDLTNESLEKIAKSCKQLSVLDISGNYDVTSKGLDTLQPLTLAHLNLTNCTDVEAASIESLRGKMIHTIIVF